MRRSDPGSPGKSTFPVNMLFPNEIALILRCRRFKFNCIKPRNSFLSIFSSLMCGSLSIKTSPENRLLSTRIFRRKVGRFSSRTLPLNRFPKRYAYPRRFGSSLKSHVPSKSFIETLNSLRRDGNWRISTVPVNRIRDMSKTSSLLGSVSVRSVPVTSRFCLNRP